MAGAFDGTTFTRLDPAASTLYAELRPISEQYDPAAAWVTEVSAGGRPVFVAYPASFDWSWVSAYLVRYSGHGNPFGFSGVLDCKTMDAVKAGVRIGKATKRSLPKSLLSTR